MWYVKNIPAWERILRLVTGGLMAACGLIGLKATPTGWLVAASGVGIILTGLVGFCPMCAMAGRKIAANKESTKR